MILAHFGSPPYRQFFTFYQPLLCFNDWNRNFLQSRTVINLFILSIFCFFFVILISGAIGCSTDSEALPNGTLVMKHKLATFMLENFPLCAPILYLYSMRTNLSRIANYFLYTALVFFALYQNRQTTRRPLVTYVLFMYVHVYVAFTEWISGACIRFLNLYTYFLNCSSFLVAAFRY